MDSAAPGLDFAVIGHQEDWNSICRFVNGIRISSQGILSLEQVKNLFPFIPPRDLFRVKVKSSNGATIHGAYIDAFIEPDKLGPQYLRSNIKKVQEAIALAKKMGARIVALGGFSSIVIEGKLDNYCSDHTKITTGNTLTTALITKGIENAAFTNGIDLNASTIMIIGATGDIGLGCVRFFKNKAKKLLLCARNKKRLQNLSLELNSEKINNEYSSSPQNMGSKADIVVCVASSSGIEFSNFKKGIVICDAGYPKNLAKKIENSKAFIFHGGMGQVTGGFEFIPDYKKSFYQYPVPNVIHGCILEAMILAFEKRFENYSSGKGNITCDKVDEIYNLGLKHGIEVSPFYNNNGVLPQNRISIN